METLVVGDVHGCARELAKLVDKAGADDVVFVGDLFTKGPRPELVYEMIRDNGWRSVMGNHDLRLIRYLNGKNRKDLEAARCIERLDHKAGPSWRVWLLEMPLFLKVKPFTIVHAGLHPSGSLKQTSRKRATTLRRWPTEKQSSPLWYQVYEGKRRVIFGHDARRGLVRIEREGEPWIIGLDTGCVYGGKLSGYLVRADRIVKVKAKRPYHAINAISVT